jgi:mannose-6-phosphate isomerase-like protein (cupin superfamily)
MAMHQEIRASAAPVPITGPRLSFPEGPFFHLHRADGSDYEIGEFRAWAGYKDLGSAAATSDVAHFQHVLSFAGTEAAGRTGVHAHLAHAHIIIPTSGRGVFSYDGVVTEAVPGSVIVQHGGTVHDQFEYSYSAASDADNRRTPQTIDLPTAGAPVRSFSFLELFVPKAFANVEIVPPGEVTDADQRTAWAHPYHTPGAYFFHQAHDAPGAAYQPMAGGQNLEARCAETWRPSAGMVATWLIRLALGSGAEGPAVALEISGEEGGVEILYAVAGSALLRTHDGREVRLETGDTLTCSQGLVAEITAASPDLRLVKFFIAAKVQALRARTAEEIARLEELGGQIVTGCEVRPEHDSRDVNFLQGPSDSGQ